MSMIFLAQIDIANAVEGQIATHSGDSAFIRSLNLHLISFISLELPPVMDQGVVLDRTDATPTDETSLEVQICQLYQGR